MKTHTKIIAWLMPLFALALFLSSPRPVNAQAAAPAAAITGTTGSGQILLATPPTLPAAIVTAPAAETSSPIGDILHYLTPIIALLVTGLANKYIPKIPNLLVPVIAASVGVGVNYLNAFTTGHPSNMWLGLLAGATATAIHQVGTHLNAAVGPSPTPLD